MPTASIPFYTNRAYKQISSKFLGSCVYVLGGGGGQLINIVFPNRYVNIQWRGTGPELSLVLVSILELVAFDKLNT